MPFVIQASESQLVGPELPNHLIDVDSRSDADGLGMGRVLFLDVVFAVKQYLDSFAALAVKVAAKRFEFAITCAFGHFFAGSQ